MSVDARTLLLSQVLSQTRTYRVGHDRKIGVADAGVCARMMLAWRFQIVNSLMND